MRVPGDIGACSFFFFNDTATTEIYTLSLHDALPISLDVDLPALGEVLTAGLRLLPPHHHVVPLGALLALALGVVPHLAGGDREARHRAAACRETHLRILPEITDQQRLVHRHGPALRGSPTIGEPARRSQRSGRDCCPTMLRIDVRGGAPVSSRRVIVPAI